MTLTRLNNRAVITITGQDRLTFLEGLLTNRVNDMQKGDARYAGLLTPQGKVISEIILYATDQALILEIAKERQQVVIQRLKLYKMRADVTIEAADDLGVVIESHKETGFKASTQSRARKYTFEPLLESPDPRHSAMPNRLITVLDKSQSLSSDTADYDSHRYQLGLPEGSDIYFEKDFWLETGADWFKGVSFDKGCYVGQELTARMKHLTTLKKAIIPITLSGAVLPGTPVLTKDEGKSVGIIRAATGGFGLAMMRLERLQEDLVADQVSVTPSNRLFPEQ